MRLAHSNKLLLILLTAIWISLPAAAQLKPAVADSFLHFIKANKERSSVYITRNDTIIAFLNEHKSMPLASSFKILVAVEFAKQCGSGLLNKEKYVALSALNKYYLAGTDGGMHPAWLKYEADQHHIKQDSIQLINIARGMIMFSSNANTEYLTDLLGVDNIQGNISLFGIRNHTPIYPIVSSLFIYQNPHGTDETKILKAINKFNDVQYKEFIMQLHSQLKNNPSFKAGFRVQDLSEAMQKNWSDRLPASTTKDYVHIANILNNRKYLSEQAYAIIAEVLEFPMENKGFQAAFKHYGVKGGSTGFVLTHVIYLTTVSGARMELAIFFNNLTVTEEKMLEGWLDPFEAQVIFDPSFRKQLSF